MNFNLFHSYFQQRAISCVPLRVVTDTKRSWRKTNFRTKVLPNGLRCHIDFKLSNANDTVPQLIKMTGLPMAMNEKYFATIWYDVKY